MMYSKRFDYKTCDHDALNEKIVNAFNEVTGSVISDGNFIDIYASIEIDPSFESNIQSEIDGYNYLDPKGKEPKIKKHVSEHLKKDNHKNIDYKTQLTTNLFPKRTIVQGEVIKVDWFLDELLADKIIEVNIVYNRDANGFAVDRTTVREWINEDETKNKDKKTTKKNYSINHVDQIVEGIKRRKLLVNNLQMPTLTFMLHALLPLGEQQNDILMKGRDFLDRYEGEFNRFVDNSSTVTDNQDPNFGKKNVVVNLENTNDVDGINHGNNYWLDLAPTILGGATIRQFLIGEFSI